MAVTQTQQLPAPFLQDISKDYATRLGAGKCTKQSNCSRV